MDKREKAGFKSIVGNNRAIRRGVDLKVPSVGWGTIERPDGDRGGHKRVGLHFQELRDGIGTLDEARKAAAEAGQRTAGYTS